MKPDLTHQTYWIISAKSSLRKGGVMLLEYAKASCEQWYMAAMIKWCSKDMVNYHNIKLIELVCVGYNGLDSFKQTDCRTPP